MNKDHMGLYIHIPFCVRKCLYCDFSSVGMGAKPDEGIVGDYIDALIKELYERVPGEIIFDTVFIGGGTPSLVSVSQMEKLLFHIEKYTEEIQMLKNDIKKKSDKLEELNKQKSDLESNNKQIYILLKKNENLLNEEINKNNIIQEKLKSKTSELKSMQEIYKNFQTTNKKQLKDYEDKIDELTKNKDDLIKQNTDLLEKLKQKMGESSGLSLDGLVESSDKESQDEISVYINENKLLKEEINKLKEQISDQAHDLVQMNSLEKNLEKIKLENEALINNNKELSEKYNKLKNDYDELSNQNNDNNINNTNKANKTCIFTKKEIPELKRMKAFRSWRARSWLTV